MSPRRHQRPVVILIAVLLQLHAMLAFALPCAMCVPGEASAAAVSETVSETGAVPPCHRPDGAQIAVPDTAIGSNAGCAHCADGHGCVGSASATAALPATAHVLVRDHASRFPAWVNPGAYCVSSLPLFRPPIV